MRRLRRSARAPAHSASTTCGMNWAMLTAPTSIADPVASNTTTAATILKIQTPIEPNAFAPTYEPIFGSRSSRAFPRAGASGASVPLCATPVMSSRPSPNAIRGERVRSGRTAETSCLGQLVDDWGCPSQDLVITGGQFSEPNSQPSIATLAIVLEQSDAPLREVHQHLPPVGRVLLTANQTSSLQTADGSRHRRRLDPLVCRELTDGHSTVPVEGAHDSELTERQIDSRIALIPEPARQTHDGNA
jgi:hypothetical protein